LEKLAYGPGVVLKGQWHKKKWGIVIGLRTGVLTVLK
jgi:hypothetical protein